MRGRQRGNVCLPWGYRLRCVLVAPYVNIAVTAVTHMPCWPPCGKSLVVRQHGARAVVLLSCPRRASLSYLSLVVLQQGCPSVGYLCSLPSQNVVRVMVMVAGVLG